ncbi:MAG: DUF1292 domain-containing protein [Mycoplasmatota bacterium]
MKSNMIKVINSDGIEKEVEVLLLFTLKDNNKDYILFTEGEVDGNLQKISASEVVKSENGYTLEKIESDLIWSKVKDVMRNVIKDEE